MLAPPGRIADEDARGEAPPVVLNLGIWTKGLEAIDIFDWQSEVKDMLSVADLELALAAAEGFLRNKVQRGELTPDHTLDIGTRRYLYFRKDRKAEIARQFGLTPVTAANIRERFLAFCEDMDMAASYKPVLLLCLLDTADEDGAVPIANLTLAFRDFYRDRLARGLPVERPKARMARVADLSEAEIQALILDMPFRKFSQRGFVDYGRDVSRVRFAPALWSRLTAEDRGRLRETAVAAVGRYYAASSAEAG